MKNITALFVLTLILILLGLSDSEAQGNSKTPHIGILIRKADRSDSLTVSGLRAGLKELGYKGEKDIRIEVYNTRNVRGTLKSAAVELVGKKVDLIFTTGSAATLAAKSATSQIPIVFRHPLDPVAVGVVKSMDKPGGNLTGVAGLSVQQADTRLEILREIVPTLRRVVIFYDIYNSISQGHFATAEVAATNLGIHVIEKPVQSDTELKKTLRDFERSEGDALYHVSDILVQSQADFIFKTARQKKLPTMFGRSDWATKGSLAGYGPNNFEMGRQAASLVDRILKGANPGELPIERAKKYDLFINLRTAKVIGITVPQGVLSRADKVIR